MLDELSWLRIVLMLVCNRSDINKSKSDLSFRSDIIVSVRSDISVRIMLMSVCISYINISNLDLSVRSGVRSGIICLESC